MKKNKKIHHAGRIVSLLLVLCMVLSIVPMTAFADESDMTGGSTDISTEVSTNASTEASTEASTNASTEASTNASTEVSTNASTNASTEASTNASTEVSTNASTEASTNASTEVSTNTSTEVSTNASTETSTNASTEASTNASTEVSTNASTEASTNASRGVIDVTGGATSNVYKHTYHTKVKMTANVTVQDSEGNTVNTYPVSEESDFLVGNVSDDAVQAEIDRIVANVHKQFSGCADDVRTSLTFDHFESSYIDGTDSGELIGGGTGKTLDIHEYQIYEITEDRIVQQDDYVIHNVVINNAPVSCTVGEAPKAMATKGDDEAYTFYEYWEEWAETRNGLEPVKFWYSNKDVSADQRITAFEESKKYSYSIVTEANENYTFASQDNLSVTMNGEDFTDKSEVILNGTGLMIGPEFMTPTTPVTEKEIPVVEINNATLTFKDGDKPVFTGTVAAGALYAIDYEGWFGSDNEFICSSDYWNNAYVERDWCDGLISSFKANTEYSYYLYLKLTDEAAAQGYVFGPNTKLKVNGKTVEYPHSGGTSAALMIGTDLTMTPTTPATQKEIPVVEINNATLTFKDGDKPVFTCTTPDDAPYVLVFEEWRTDGEWTRSDEWFNDADHHGDDKDITAFDKNKNYKYGLYLKTTAEGSEEGWYFGQNTKLKINGKEVSFARDTSDNEQQFMVTTGITMTPTAADASDYKIIEGANGAWTQNTDGTLTFRANGDFSKFTGVKVDDELIDAKNYTAKSGSTVITLKTDYLKTLSVGTHKLTVVYTDGECSTNFEVKQAASEQTKPTEGDKTETTTPTEGDKTDTTTPTEGDKTDTTTPTEGDKTDTTTPTGGKDTTSPKTGDNSKLLLWAALLFVSGAGVIGTTVYGKKKRAK